MKVLLTTRYIAVPKGVTYTLKGRAITVTGPRGTLSREFNHVRLELTAVGKKRIRVDLWNGLRKQVACVRTIASHIENMMTGVTRGFRYKMRLVYNHFPIAAVVKDDGATMEVRNFLGEKRVRRVPMYAGVHVEKATDAKDTLILEGNDIQAVSQSAAAIHDQCLVKRKDIRKFLDGVYVSEKGPIPEPEE